MIFIQRSISLIVIAFLFIGTVGVNVFEHICKKDGVSISYVLNSGEDQCGNHHDQHEEEAKKTSCCHKKESNNDKGCCSDDVEYFKLKVDTSTPNNEKFAFPIQIAKVENSALQIVEIERLEDHYTSDYVNPPPPESVRQRIKKQVWII